MALPTAARADDITIAVYASSAPNAYGSPSWAGYVANAMTGIANGGAATGDPSQPTYYSSGTSFDPGQLIVTDYNSWDGVTDPAAPFNDELGNRLHFGTEITDTDGTFDLQDVSFSLTSSDAAGDYTDPVYCPSGNGGSLCYQGDLSGTNFSAGTRIGIEPDGTVCDTTSGCTDTTPLKELIYVGVGNAFCSGQPDDCGGSDFTAIADLDQYMADNAPFSVTTQYCVKGSCGSATADINAAPVPEPATMTLFTTGLLGLGGMIRRRRFFRVAR